MGILSRFTGVTEFFTDYCGDYNYDGNQDLVQEGNFYPELRYFQVAKRQRAIRIAHSDLASRLRYARLNGPPSKFIKIQNEFFKFPDELLNIVETGKLGGNDIFFTNTPVGDDFRRILLTSDGILIDYEFDREKDFFQKAKLFKKVRE